MSSILKKVRPGKKGEKVESAKVQKSKSLKSGKDRDDSNSLKLMKLSRQGLSSKEKMSTKPKSPSVVKDNKPRKARSRNLSRLETLPLEILTLIFLQSLEISLPQTSPILASRLSSSYVVDKFLSYASQLDDVQINRLLRCNLFTWSLVRFRPHLPALLFTNPALNTMNKGHEIVHMRHIQIPAKILRGPWTPENVALLKWFVNNGPRRFPDPGPIAREAAKQGLWIAIDEGNAAAVILIVSAMHACSDETRAHEIEIIAEGRSMASIIRESMISLRFSVTGEPSALGLSDKLVPMFATDSQALNMGQSLLRHAILDSTPESFSREIIVAIIHFDLAKTTGARLDLLDSTLWAWAERDKQQSSEDDDQKSNGEWLEELLKLAGRVKVSEWFLLVFCKAARKFTYNRYDLSDKKVGWLFGAFVWEWMALYDKVPH